MRKSLTKKAEKVIKENLEGFMQRPWSLSELTKIGARMMIQAAVEEEVTAYLERDYYERSAEAAEQLKQIPYAETLAECVRRRDAFVEKYRKDYAKAVEKLLVDWDRMVTFYSFPKEHWPHLRTTNVVESPFSSVRLRTDAAKRFKKVQNATAMIWKLLQVAEKNFRSLKGHWLLSDVYSGKTFIDGVLEQEKMVGERMAA